MGMTAATQGTQESGFVLYGIFAMLIPILVALVAVTTDINNKSSELRCEVEQELALLAAESGIDGAMYEARLGRLKDGDVYKRKLGGAQSFDAEVTYLKNDGKDNDGDGSIDENDEDAFQVVVAGTYRGTTRRLAAYVGPVPPLPKLDAAFATQDPNIAITLMGASLVSGFDKRIDGSAGTGSDRAGIAIAPPGTVAHLTSELTGGEPNKVEGAGGLPSLDTTNFVDLTTLVTQYKNAADRILTADHYTDYSFGNGLLGTSMIAYREGNVKFDGTSRGAGILVVTGDLEIAGTFRYDGVVIVLGKVNNSAGTANIYGSILQGPKGGTLVLKGTADIVYSTEAIALADKAAGNYVAFNGWQEIAR